MCISAFRSFGGQRDLLPLPVSVKSDSRMGSARNEAEHQVLKRLVWEQPGVVSRLPGLLIILPYLLDVPSVP